MARALRPCSTAGCPTLVAKGKCPACRTRAEQRRGSAHSRGYDHRHATQFRAGVLAKDPICVLCRAKPSTDADHWPVSRRDLVRQGLDPHDPRYGRGLCHACHSRSTAKHQPSGFNIH